MKLRTLNHWIALAANVGVMAGIIFLAYELQQNTVATQLEAATNFQSSFSSIEETIYADPKFAELLERGRKNEPLTETEAFRISIFYANVLRQWQVNHFLYLSGALDQGIWLGNQSYMRQVFGNDIGLLNQWRATQEMYSPAFNEMISTITDHLP